MGSRRERTRSSVLRSAGLALIATLLACGSDAVGAKGPAPSVDDVRPDTPGEPTATPSPTATAVTERPWEIVSNKGEAYLPNVFYADPSENEQIMPYAIDGHVMIDRLVYPTLGNPNLYTKSDPTDELVVVLRMEEPAYAQLGAKIEPVAGSALSRLVVDKDASNGFAFFLVPRAGRELSTAATQPVSSAKGTNVVRIYPDDVLVSPEPPDMPAALKKRKTLRFVFRQGQMAKVPAALYDLRFEMKQDDKLVRAADGAAIYEYQYNAVRVFEDEPDTYPVVNVTDTQVSVGGVYDSYTTDKLSQWVQFVNTTNDPAIRSAPFITFNGDLHNGGSPGSLSQKTVAWTYEKEAEAIVSLFKNLPMPIFLTVGNHDGYVSIGQVPGAVKTVDAGLGEDLAGVIADASPKAWPGFTQASFDAFLQKTTAADQLGGFHRDLFTGGFARSPATDDTTFTSWKEVPRENRNQILYDGFYQWQKTYGPLYYSHRFGKNHWVSLNSYELRQHRRAGWGMYTVNYGGGVGDVQIEWFDRQLARATTDGMDVVVLAHHDPRGGHEGKDPGYYFEQLEFKSIYQSAFNYVGSQYVNEVLCKLPDWAQSGQQTNGCLHDGLQEWMRPDPEFDCTWNQRKPDFTCHDGVQPFTSSVELMKRIAGNGRVRTMLLGHTHYNSLEVLQQGDELVPGALPVDPASAQKFATWEVENPLRGFSAQNAHGARADYDHHTLGITDIERSYADFAAQYEQAVSGWQRTLSGTVGPRELVVLRFVSNADLTDQTYSSGKTALGFGVLFVEKKSDARAVDLPQINRAKFFANVGGASFAEVGEIDVERTGRLHPHDATNPVQQLYEW
jgi:hypothetical protein